MEPHVEGSRPYRARRGRRGRRLNHCSEIIEDEAGAPQTREARIPRVVVGILEGSVAKNAFLDPADERAASRA